MGKVIISAAPKESVPIYVMGVNHLDHRHHRVERLLHHSLPRHLAELHFPVHRRGQGGGAGGAGGCGGGGAGGAGAGGCARAPVVLVVVLVLLVLAVLVLARVVLLVLLVLAVLVVLVALVAVVVRGLDPDERPMTGVANGL